MTVKALFIGARTLSSTGQVSAQGLAPTRFSDKSRTEVAAHFDWSLEKARKALDQLFSTGALRKRSSRYRLKN